MLVFKKTREVELIFAVFPTDDCLFLLVTDSMTMCVCVYKLKVEIISGQDAKTLSRISLVEQTGWSYRVFLQAACYCFMTRHVQDLILPLEH